MLDFLFGWMIGRSARNARLPDSVRQQQHDAVLERRAQKHTRKWQRRQSSRAWWDARTIRQKQLIILAAVALVVAAIVVGVTHPRGGAR